MDNAAAKVAGISAPFGKPDYVALLSDPRLELNARGTKLELMERLFESRAFIITQLGLSAEHINGADPFGGVQGIEDDDPITCQVCEGGPSEENPIIKCDGQHEFEVGYHLCCLPSIMIGGVLTPPAMPAAEDDWLCPSCINAGLCIIQAVKGKRKHKSRVQYLVSYVGCADDQDRWEDFQHLKEIAHVRDLIRQFNLQRVHGDGNS